LHLHGLAIELIVDRLRDAGNPADTHILRRMQAVGIQKMQGL
jgi:hypothetical protein